MTMQGAGSREKGAEEGIANQKSTLLGFGGVALILLCAAAATVPQMLRGPSCGHDFDFHLVSWLDALNSWRHGIFYPSWAPSPNFGAGEPRFIFYPPVTWMLGALLGAILPWRIVPQALTCLLFAATGLATRALARQALGKGVATLAGCAAIFSGYALFTAYERSAFAEMTGGFWVPIMLMLMLGSEASPPTLATKTKTPGGRGTPVFVRPALLLALVVAGAWLSNAPLGVMLSYLLAGLAVLLALMRKSWLPIVRATIGAALGLGLAAFFLVPADWEQRWVDIRQAIEDPGELIENSWLFARHANPRLELHDIELIRVSAIGVTMIGIALAAVGMSWWRRTLPADRRWWIPLALIPVGVLFLQLPVSDFVWHVLPKMRFLQFPWRWLVVIEAPMAIFFASAVWPGRRAWRVVMATLCTAAFAGAIALADRSFFQDCDEDDAVSGVIRDYHDGVGFPGTDEYAAPNADNSLVATSLPLACLVSDPEVQLGKGDPDMTPDWSADQHSCDATWSEDASHPSPEHLRLEADTPHPGYLVLRLRTYPAWRLRLNGQTVTAMPEREDGLTAVPVPRGRVRLAVDWTTTPDVTAGHLISLTALVLITGLWLWERRRSRAQLS